MWPSPLKSPKKETASEFSEIPGGLITPKSSEKTNDGGQNSTPHKPLESPSPKSVKKYGKNNSKLTEFYYEKLSKDRTESHILEEIDTATVDVTEDVDDDEKIQQELDKDDMEAFRQELHGAKKQTTRREDGLATIFFVIKTSWSVEFVHFIHYLVFLFLLTQVVLGPPRINRWFMHRSYQDHFISNEDPANAIVSFEKINTKAQFFDWMESTFVPNMFPGYVDEQATNYTHNNIYETKLANGMGYRLGAVRLVQLRVEDDGCQVSKLFERAVTRCNPKFTDPVEQVTESHLGESWQSEAMLGTGDFYSYLTKQRYDGSGYATHVDITSQTASDLKASTYVDFSTRLISMSFLTYNPPLDLLLRGTFNIEFMGSGDVIPTYTFKIIEEWKWKHVWEGATSDVSFWFCILCEIGVYLYTVSYLWEEIREVFYWGPSAYISSAVNVFELFNIFTLVNVFMFRYLTITGLDDLESTLPTNDYVQTNVVASYSQISANLLAASAIVSYMKIFKYLQFHRGIAQFVNTIFKSSFEVSTFIIIMGVVIVSYALALYMAFGHVIRGYMDFAESLFTLFKSTMGQFTIREISQVNSSGRYLGPFLFISFIVLNLFVILSMLFAMVNVSFHTIRDEMVKEDNHPENSPIVVDITRILNAYFRLISYIPGVPEKEFSQQVIKRRKKRIARWVSGESKLLTFAKEKRDRQRAAEEALMSGEEKERRRKEGDSMEVKPLVKNPRKDLLGELIIVEAKQRKMLNVIENLSRVVRAQTFNRINKQMEDLTDN